MSEPRVSKNLEIVNPDNRPVGIFPAMAERLRTRLVALSCEVENLDNELIETIEKIVEVKKEGLAAAKEILAVEKEFLKNQL